MEPSRVVITGGTGLIGRVLASELAAAGRDVVLLSRSPASTGGLSAGVRALPYHPSIVDGAQAVVNLAGENLSSGRWTPERRKRIRESRLQAGQFVSEAVERASVKPRVVVQASAVGYYGPRGDDEVTEATPPGDDFLAQTCVAWEASTSAVEQLGVRRVITRIGLPLTPQGGVLPRLLLPYRFFVGGPLGSGWQWYSWIHLADEIGAILFLMNDESAQGAYNLTAPQPARNAEISRELGRALGRPSLVPVPSFALRLVFGEMATVVLDGQRAVPQRLMQAGYVFRFSDLRSALADLLRS